MSKNVFIAFEGIDGSGKSTQARLLSQRLEQEGHKVYLTFEPSDHPIGKMIRDIFAHRMEADHRTIAALFAADRLEHLLNKTNGILKKLEEGYTVLSDRYYFSSYAYHSVHMPMDWVLQLNAPCVELLRPTLNIFIEADVDECMKRITGNRSGTELYETHENLVSVRNKYREALEKLKHEEALYICNGNRSSTEIAEDIYAKVLPMIQ